MPDAKPRLLLHVCCGPCSTEVIERLRPRFDLTLFFANPNLAPAEEYERRLAAARGAAARYAVPLLTAKDDHDAWLQAVRGLEWEREGGARCEACFRVRLEETAREAKRGGFDLFATTLTISPHKNAAVVFRTGHFAAMKHGVRLLEEDFKKKDGYHRSVVRSHEMGLYRQGYCGCEFSLREREKGSPKAE